MKRILLLSLFAISVCSVGAQTPIVTAYTFPTDQGEGRLNPTTGLDENLSYPITMEDTEGHDYSVTMADGAGGPTGGADYAAAAQNWEDGADKKFFCIKCKAADYVSFNITSKVYSDATKPGPKDWKIMWRHSGGEWNDLEGGTFSIASDWTTGEMTAISLPEAANNPEDFLYIAWMPTTNLDVNGDPVTAEGTVRIDDIFINGVEGNAVENLVYENGTTIYPNPAQTVCTISAEKGATAIDIFDLSGRLVFTNTTPNSVNTVPVSTLSSGVYMVRVSYESTAINRKLVVR